MFDINFFITIDVSMKSSFLRSEEVWNVWFCRDHGVRNVSYSYGNNMLLSFLGRDTTSAQINSPSWAGFLALVGHYELSSAEPNKILAGLEEDKSVETSVEMKNFIPNLACKED